MERWELKNKSENWTTKQDRTENAVFQRTELQNWTAVFQTTELKLNRVAQYWNCTPLTSNSNITKCINTVSWHQPITACHFYCAKRLDGVCLQYLVYTWKSKRITSTIIFNCFKITLNLANLSECTLLLSPESCVFFESSQLAVILQ